jgi:hypothetical protein
MTATREPSTAAIERDLRTAARRSKIARERADKADEQRDRVIRDALALKVPRARIAELTDLSVPRVDQIRASKR